MSDEHDITYEPVAGLPERPPPGEEILWQGRPATWALAKESLCLSWVGGYFALLAVWRVGASAADMPLAQALLTATPLVVLGLGACLILAAIAWVQARATVYTVTSHRVAMRIGAALTVTMNLPFPQITAAHLDLRRGGTGTIALETTGEKRLSYFVCWPHVRPWRMARPEPALRCIPDAARVARILADAAETRVRQPVLERIPEAVAVAAE